MSDRAYNPHSEIRIPQSTDFIMFLLDDLLLAPVNGFKFILGQIQKLADQELNDDTLIKEQLLELQMRLELDEISEEDYRVRETAEVELLEVHPVRLL